MKPTRDEIEEKIAGDCCQQRLCHICNGTGKVPMISVDELTDGTVVKETRQTVCRDCNGTGELTKEELINMENKDLVIKENIVMPAVTAEKAVEIFNEYQRLAEKILTKDDIQVIQGKDFKKKSFWRKCQRFFNLSIQVLDEKREQYDGYFIYKFIVRAKAPNGAFMDGTGACSSNEKGLEKTEHNTRATAETRAKNRAIADLVAFGEVSAEEVSAEENNISSKHPDMFITDKQRKRLYAIWKEKKYDDQIIQSWLKEKYGIDNTKEIKAEWYEDICEAVQNEKI